MAGPPEQRSDALVPPVGGENSPPPSEPWKMVVDTAVLTAGEVAVRVPTGQYTAPPGGAKAYSVPGPISAVRGPDGTWRGHGYLETYPRLLSFTGRLDGDTATLDYRFEGGKSYRVTLTAKDGTILLDEQSDLGPRNLFVFDCYYNWQPAAGFVSNLPGRTASYVYLPCYYDKPEATVNPAADRKRPAGRDGQARGDEQIPGAVAVTSAKSASRDVVGVFCRDVDSWQNPASMGLQLWQRRQRPGEPASRHFLGPETKSDSTPNPRTAGMLGQSRYEGHVTIEMNLGRGSRKLGFVVCGKGKARSQLHQPFLSLVRAHR
jgi:hypothetical protein